MKVFNKVLILVLFCITAQGQLDKSFFRKLHTQKVSSWQGVSWQQFGPGTAGYCEEFWCHPTNSKVMFMSPDMFNSYGSWDNGVSWQTIKDVDGTGKDLRRLKGIEFSRQNQNFGFAIDVRGQLYKTLDLGKNWQKQTSFPSLGKHSVITVDPCNDKIWYVGAGDFWNVKSNHKSKSNLIGNQYKYAAYGHVLKTKNGGKTWKKITTGLSSKLDVARIIVDPNNSKNVFLAANTGFYVSTNGGKKWKLSGNGLPNNKPRDLTSFYDKKTKEFILYLLEQTFYDIDGKSTTAKGGIYKSIDLGKTWQNISGNIAIDLTQIKNYTVRQYYYRAMGYWFGMSKKEFEKKYPELPKQTFTVFNRIKVDPNNKDVIYLSHNVKHDKAFGPGNVWRTKNGGKNWVVLARHGADWIKGKDKEYWESRNNPTHIDTRFAHLQKEMNEKNENQGNRFMQINKNGEVFVCLEQQILRTKNQGDNWFQIDDIETSPASGNWIGRGGSNLPGRFMLLETGVLNRKFFCSGEHGLWQSANLEHDNNKQVVAVKQIEGQNNHKGATSIASVAVHPHNPDIIYMIMFRQNHRGYFRRSIDGGKTWKNIGEPLHFGGNISMEHLFQYSLTVDYKNPNNIYFTMINNPIAEVSGQRLPKGFDKYGVLKSIDGGFNWELSNNGLPLGCSVRRIKIDPKNPNILYAALNQSRGKEKGGLYKSINNGSLWEPIKIPYSIQSVNNVFVDRNTHHIYISCGTDKGTLEEGGVWKSENDGVTWIKIFDMPYIWQTEVSPVNSNIITVNAPLPNERKGAVTINPGAYLSLDGGKSWKKINKNLGQPDTIVDLKPDPKDQNVLWCALKGSGWAKAKLHK